MATKEDILEQIVEEYLVMKGYFVQHNIKYKPDPNRQDYISKFDSVHSDIDVLGINPNLSGVERVLAVNCKSWQGGFQPLSEIKEFETPKTKNRARWKSYRELTSEKWSDAFSNAIKVRTGSAQFTHVTAVTLVKPRKGFTIEEQINYWEQYKPFSKILNGNPAKVLTLSEMIICFENSINQTPASSEVGRLIQVMRAAGIWPSAKDLTKK